MSVKMRMPKLMESLSAPLQTDTKPYLIKPVPIGNRERLKLIGGTVAVNQLVQSPDFTTTPFVPNGTATVSDGVAVITSNGNGNCYASMYTDLHGTHVYLMALSLLLDSGNTLGSHEVRLVTSWSGGYTNFNNVPKGAWQRLETIVKPTGAPSGYGYTVYFFGTATTPSGQKASIKAPLYIDLTQMFGSTIADYAYTLEQGHAGDGIAWLKSYGFFAKDYYPYDAGSLLSVKTSGHVSGGHSYPLSDIELRGIPKLVSGAIEYDGDSYEADGTVTRRYGVVDLGTLAWTYDSSVPRFYTNEIADIKAQPNTGIAANAISKYETLAFDTFYNQRRNGTLAVSSGGYLSIIDTAYSTAAAFKTAMSGVHLVYELATPTTETADAYENPQIVETGGTESFIDGRTVEMPVGNVSEYCEAVKSVSIGMRMGKGLSVKMRMGGEL